MCPVQLEPETHACALTGNLTCDLLLCGSMPNWVTPVRARQNQFWIPTLPQTCSVILHKYSLLLFSSKDLLTYFRQRRKGERERGREKHQLIASRMHPNWGLKPQPRHVPEPGIESTTFQFTGQCFNQLSHTNQSKYYVLLRFISFNIKIRLMPTSLGCMSSA